MTDLIVMWVSGMVFGTCITYLLCRTFQGYTESLTNAKVGKVYNFFYHQPLTGDSQRFLVRVLEVNKLSDDSIRRLNQKSGYRKHDTQFMRTAHLVTAQTPDGKIRNFYAERTSNVRRPFLGNLLFRRFSRSSRLS